MAEDAKEQSKSKDRSVVSQKVLFVRNLPFSTTDQDLENIFSEVGPIKRCFVIRDKGEKSVLGKTTDTCTCTVCLKLMLEICNLYSKVLTHSCLSLIKKKTVFQRLGI